MEMGSQTRKIFLSLYDRVVELFYEWKIFQQLFASGDDNLRLLNESGSNVFVLLRNLIMDDVFLGLCRLTDPAEMGRHENLSLRWLLGELRSSVCDDWRRDVEEKLGRLDGVMKNIRDHRRKRIAHFDLKCATKAEPLPSVIYGDVEDALDLVATITRAFFLVVMGADTAGIKEPSIAYGCDGNYLLSVLRRPHERKEN